MNSIPGPLSQHSNSGLSPTREASCVAAFRVVMLAHHCLHAQATRVAARFGLHIAELNVIDMLGKLGAVSMGELSNATFISTSNTTHTVKKLESRGYVQRRPGATSQRVVLVSLTQKGLELFARCYPDIVCAIEAQLACLSLEQRNVLVQLLGGFDGDIPAPSTASTTSSKDTARRHPRAGNCR